RGDGGAIEDLLKSSVVPRRDDAVHRGDRDVARGAVAGPAGGDPVAAAVRDAFVGSVADADANDALLRRSVQSLNLLHRSLPINRRPHRLGWARAPSRRAPWSAQTSSDSPQSPVARLRSNGSETGRAPGNEIP